VTRFQLFNPCLHVFVHNLMKTKVSPPKSILHNLGLVNDIVMNQVLGIVRLPRG